VRSRGSEDEVGVLGAMALERLQLQQQRLGLVPRIRLHDLTHTWATLALQAGEHPKVVSEILGHANISITLDTYSHVIPAMQQRHHEGRGARVRWRRVIRHHLSKGQRAMVAAQALQELGGARARGLAGSQSRGQGLRPRMFAIGLQLAL